MPKYSFTLNGKKVRVEAPADLSVLWTLRDKLGVTGPKYGCGINVCKACTSHIDGQLFNPCVTDVSEVQGRSITTIEGVADGDRLHPVQQAWLEQDVAQCGFCQPGQIMAAIALLKKTRNPTDADIETIDNVCRCGTYFRIREAVKRSVELMDERGMLVGSDSDSGAVPAGGDGSGEPQVALGSLPATGVSAETATTAGALLAAAYAARRLATAETGEASPA